jgi:hypothetical protein
MRVQNGSSKLKKGKTVQLIFAAASVATKENVYQLTPGFVNSLSPDWLRI